MNSQPMAKTPAQKHRAKIKRKRNEADRLFQEVCLKRNPYCEACGKQATQIHHFVPRSLSNNLRYDLNNGISLCKGCHHKHHAAGDPAIYEAITRNKSKEWFKYIREQRDKPVKVSLQWYEEQINKLKEYEENKQ